MSISHISDQIAITIVYIHALRNISKDWQFPDIIYIHAYYRCMFIKVSRIQKHNYSTSFANMCYSEQSHIVHGRFLPVPFTTQTVTHIMYEVIQQGLQSLYNVYVICRSFLLLHPLHTPLSTDEVVESSTTPPTSSIPNPIFPWTSFSSEVGECVRMCVDVCVYVSRCNMLVQVMPYWLHDQL